MNEPYPPCICCGNTHFKISGSLISGFLLVKCQQCQSAFTWPRLSVEEIEKYYLQSYYGPENVKFISALERVVEWITDRRAEWISRMLPPVGNVLEIGCGRGLLLSALQQRGHHCFGIERSELASRRAREIPGLQISTNPLANCGFPSGSFDLVILWHVLEHLPDPTSTIRDIHQLLKPGALLILEVPNLAAIQSRLSGLFWFHLDVERHLFHFTPQGLMQLLNHNFFQCRSNGTYSWEQSPYGALQSLMNLILSPPERLYKILKREGSFSLCQKAVHLGMAAILLIPALCLAVIEAGMGKGAVLRIIAQKSST